jgi:alkaline phosphatase D
MIDLGTKVIGVWDDHDFGINDGDKTFSQKHFTRDIFLDFIDEPEDSIRRTDRNSSIHQDYIIHGKNNFKTHIMLIDNRFDFDKKLLDRLGD